LPGCLVPGCRRLLYTSNPYEKFALKYRGGLGWVQELYQEELLAQTVLTA